MKKIAAIVIGLGLALGSTSVAFAGSSPPPGPLPLKATNSASSKHSVYLYTGSGCTGTKVTLHPNYYVTGNFRSAKASYKYKLSLSAKDPKTYSANQCVSFYPTGIYAWVT